MSITLTWPPWPLNSKSFFTPARATHSPISVHSAITVAGVGLVAALAVRAWQRRRGFSTRASGLALVLLLAMGVGHLLYWLLTTVLK